MARRYDTPEAEAVRPVTSYRVTRGVRADLAALASEAGVSPAKELEALVSREKTRRSAKSDVEPK